MQDVHHLALDVINLDNRRVPFLANDTRAADRRRKEAWPIVRIPIQRLDAISWRIHVFADDGVGHVCPHDLANES